MSARPFPLPKHQAAKRTGLVRIPVAAQGSVEDRKDQRHRRAALWARCLSWKQPVFSAAGGPQRPAPGHKPEAPALGSIHYLGRGLRRHRGDEDYSADKAACRLPPQLSHHNRHAAASHRSPCFRERLPLLFPAPSQRMSSPESYPSQHPHPVAERAPGMQSCLPFSLPPDFPFPVGVRPRRSHSHGVPLAPHPTPPLFTAAADAQDRAPSFLHPFSLVIPHPQKRS